MWSGEKEQDDSTSWGCILQSTCIKKKIYFKDFTDFFSNEYSKVGILLIEKSENYVVLYYFYDPCTAFAINMG